MDPKTIPVLDKIGEVLQREELQDFAFVVEGHTDASGSETYNRELSWQRAEAVRNYPVRKHGVDEKRLAIHGMLKTRTPFESHRFYALPEAAS
ncbi:MAG: OmpA family protein [Candidatus Thiosymbion ectosymbiont of Robbea hypermnestra]|nr:OmpA family protein [Candidatus Thiosymbion ectosymbiont of Robbea hypermnestra]